MVPTFLPCGFRGRTAGGGGTHTQKGSLERSLCWLLVILFSAYPMVTLFVYFFFILSFAFLVVNDEMP